MQFSRDLRPRVADGTITVSYRLWSRPFSSITDDDLARQGEPDRDSLRARAAHAGPIDDDTLVYRVEFHVVAVLDDEI